jgi:hypothetical protein
VHNILCIHHRGTESTEGLFFVCRGDARQTKDTLFYQMDFWPKTVGSSGESSSPDSPENNQPSVFSVPQASSCPLMTSGWLNVNYFILSVVKGKQKVTPLMAAEGFRSFWKLSQL